MGIFPLSRLGIVLMKNRNFLTGSLALALAAGTLLVPKVAEAVNRQGGGSHGGGGMHSGSRGSAMYAGGMHHGGRYHGGYVHRGGYYGGGYYGGGYGGGYYGYCGPIPNVLGFCAPLPFGL